jgi:hypothetical protein
VRITPATTQTLGLKKRKGLSAFPVDKTWRSAFFLNLSEWLWETFPRGQIFVKLAGTTKKIEKRNRHPARTARPTP